MTEEETIQMHNEILEALNSEAADCMANTMLLSPEKLFVDYLLCQATQEAVHGQKERLCWIKESAEKFVRITETCLSKDNFNHN